MSQARVLNPVHDGKIEIRGAIEDNTVRKIVRMVGPEITGSEQFVGGLATFEPGTEVALHAHPDAEEVNVVVEGSGLFVTKEGEKPIARGDWQIIPKGVEHCHKNTGTGPLTIVWLYSPPSTTFPKKRQEDKMRLQCKRPVTIGNKVIGGAAPLICLPIVAKNTKELLQQVGELIPLKPDIIEWRIDGFDDVENIDNSLQALSELRNAIGSTPLIFTCRIDREGGMRSISREKRLELITAAVGTGHLDIVDTELCNDRDFIEKVLEGVKQQDAKLILSFHDFEKTPDESDILNRLIRAQQLGAHIAKAAVMPKSYSDVLVLLSATLKARTQALEIPIVTMSMAAEGGVTRLAGGLFGSDITFAIGKSASAPGQIPIGDLRQAMSVLY